MPECGTAFYGRADARYCGGACRQKADRARTKNLTAEEGVTAPASGDMETRTPGPRERPRRARTRSSHPKRRVCDPRSDDPSKAGERAASPGGPWCRTRNRRPIDTKPETVKLVNRQTV